MNFYFHSKRRQIFLANKQKHYQETLEFEMNTSKQTFFFDSAPNSEIVDGCYV